MNRNRLLFGAVLALLLGLLASVFVYKKVQQQAASAPPPVTSQLVVAAARLPLGARLRPQDLRVVSWPANSPMAGSFAKAEDCAGRAVIQPLAENEPILEENLAPKDAGAGLPAVIPEGMRAVSVRVDDVVGVAGFAMPGTMVDVQVTGEFGGTSVTHTILEYVRVLAAGQKVEQDKEGKPQTVNVVTLQVDPAQADKLTMASTSGRIHLSLRNTIDTKLVDSPAVYMTSLFGGAPPKLVGTKRAAAPRLAPAAVVVEVFRGDKKESTTFHPQ